MSKIEKYIKLVKNIVIKPEKKDIEKKIIKRIENLNEDDRKLLDDKFMEYLKKNNSRLYLFKESVKNNPARFVMLVILFLFFSGIFVLILGMFYSPPSKNQKEQ